MNNNAVADIRLRRRFCSLVVRPTLSMRPSWLTDYDVIHKTRSTQRIAIVVTSGPSHSHS